MSSKTHSSSMRVDPIEIQRHLAVDKDEAADFGLSYAIWRKVFEQTNAPVDGLNLAFAAFRDGRWADGWEHYENRYKVDAGKNLDSITCGRTGQKIPHWTTGPPPKSLLVIAEQGIGDTIHFLRFLKRLVDQGTRITLAEWPAIHSVINCCNTKLRLIARNEATDLRSGQAFVRLLSLPRRMRLDEPFYDDPYLLPPQSEILKWRPWTRSDRLNVGFVWQGNSDHPRDERRSMPFGSLEPILKSEKIHAISLQHGKASYQIDHAGLGSRIVEPTGLFGEDASLMKTAAMIASLDAVVSVDTAVAHIAGAMGVPCFLMLHWPDPDWRWGKDDLMTPWYPRHRLVRQSHDASWSAVVQSVMENVGKLERSARGAPSD